MERKEARWGACVRAWDAGMMGAEAAPVPAAESSRRVALSDAEKKEFDNVTRDAIQAMTDMGKLRRLAQYMREEGFEPTWSAARARLRELGEVDERAVSAGERETALRELNAFVRGAKADDAALRAQGASKKQAVPEVRGRSAAPAAAPGEYIVPVRDNPSKRILEEERRSGGGGIYEVGGGGGDRNEHQRDRDAYFQKWDAKAESAVREMEAEDAAAEAAAERELRSSGRAPGSAVLSGTGADLGTLAGPKLLASLLRKSAVERKWVASQEKEKGNEFFKTKEYPNAVRCYNLAVALEPNNAVHYANRATCFIRLKRFDDAETDCDASLKCDPGYMKAYVRRGVARKEQGKLEASVADFEAALKLEPENKEVAGLLKKARADHAKSLPKRRVSIMEVDDSDEEGDGNEAPPKAKAAAPQAAAKAKTAPKANEAPPPRRAPEPEGVTRNGVYYPPKMPKATIEEVVEEEEEERPTAGGEELLEVLGKMSGVVIDEGKPDGSSASATTRQAPSGKAEKEAEAERVKEAANALFRSGDLRGALAGFTEALGLHKSAALYSNRAATHLKMGNAQAAEDDCTEALRCDKFFVKAYHRRATARKELGKLTEALEDLQQVLWNMPAHPQVQGDIDDVKRLIAAKEVDSKAKKPPAPAPEMHKGKERKRLVIEEDDEDEEEEAREKAAAGVASAESSEDAKNRGNRLFQEGKLAEAVEAYTVALRLEPGNLAALSNRAAAHVKAGQPALAEADCDAVLAIDPGHLKALNRRSGARRALGNLAGSLADLERVLRAMPGSASVENEIAAIKAELEAAKPAKAAKPVQSTPAEAKSQRRSIVIEEEDSEEEDATSSSAALSSRFEANGGHTPDLARVRGTSMSPGAAGASPVPPSPVRASDFERAALKLRDDPIAFAEYLRAIDPSTFKGLFGSSLNDAMLVAIVRSVTSQMVDSAPEEAVKYLEGLSVVERFTLTAMTLRADVKKDLKDAFAKLDALSGGVSALRKKYGC